jgi:DNA-binding NtrC family response regulator
MEHSWPGNVRELENVIQRAVALSGGRVITPDDLQLVPQREVGRPSGPQRSLPESLTLLERQMVTEALERSSGNLEEAARLLGITVSYLRQKMEQYHLDVPPPSEANPNGHPG